MNALELGEGRLAEAWRHEVHESGNPSLYEGFNSSPDVQLLDAMMRSPAAGRAILDYVDNGQPARDTRVRAALPNVALEMSLAELNRGGDLTVTSPGTDIFEMTREGWNRNGVPMRGQYGREVDVPDHTDGLRSRPLIPGNERHLDQTQVHDQPNSLLGWLYEAAVNKGDKAMDTALMEYVRVKPSTPSQRGGPENFEHPENALLEKMRTGVRDLDQQIGKPWDEQSERLSASALAMAVEKKFNPDDDVWVGLNQATERHTAGELLLVQRVGGHVSPDPFQNRTHMFTTEALSQSAEQRYQQVEAVRQTQAEEQQRPQMEVLARSRNPSLQDAPTMSM